MMLHQKNAAGGNQAALQNTRTHYTANAIEIQQKGCMDYRAIAAAALVQKAFCAFSCRMAETRAGICGA